MKKFEMKTSVDGKSAVHQSSPLALKRKRNGNLPVGGAGGVFFFFFANGTVCSLIAPQRAGTLVAVISLSRRMRLKHLLKHLLVLRSGPQEQRAALLHHHRRMQSCFSRHATVRAAG